MVKRRGSPCLVTLSALVLFTCIVLFASKSLVFTSELPENVCRAGCGKDRVEAYKALKRNIWSDLDDDEFDDLLDYLYSPGGKVLNLTRIGSATA